MKDIFKKESGIKIQESRQEGIIGFILALDSLWQSG
jgi:hypothetical protein